MQNPKKVAEEEEPQEELLVWFLDLWGKVEQNYTQILAGIGVAVVAVLVVVFVMNYQNQEKLEAQNELGNVYIALFEGRVDDAINNSQRLSEQYAGDAAGKEALIALANLQFEQKRISEAQANFQKLLDQYGSEGLLGYGAWSGLAYCLEAEGKFEQAAQKFKSYADANSNTPFAPVALKEAGRCFQLGKNQEQAKNVYQSVVDTYKTSSVYRNVKNQLAMMGVDVEG